jgi:cobalt-zinc-cadmium efflux system outer membrane protein
MRCTLVRASRWRRGQLLLFVLLSASFAKAEPGQPDSGPVPTIASDGSFAAVVRVTWPDIVRLVDQHPQLASSKLQTDAARAAADASSAIPNPALEATVGQGRALVGDSSRLEWGLSLSMPLGWIAQRGSRIDQAEAEVDAVEAESNSLRREVLLQFRTLFWNLVYERDRIASLVTLEAQISQLVRTVNKRVEMGEVRPVEATRVEIELEKVTAELEAARISLSSRQAQLALQLGVPAGTQLVPIADLDALPVAMDRETALARARTTHPVLAVARARTRSLEADVSIERMARFFSFSITGFAAYELDRRAYGVGLAVDLPVWNWNSGRIAQANAKLAAGRMQADSSALELESAVIEAQAACHSSVATATRLGNNVLPRSETAAATIEKTYQLGEASLLDVIDARRTLLDARHLYMSALAQAQINCSRLGALVGEESK